MIEEVEIIDENAMFVRRSRSRWAETGEDLITILQEATGHGTYQDICDMIKFYNQRLVDRGYPEATAGGRIRDGEWQPAGTFDPATTTTGDYITRGVEFVRRCSDTFSEERWWADIVDKADHLEKVMKSNLDRCASIELAVVLAYSLGELNTQLAISSAHYDNVKRGKEMVERNRAQACNSGMTEKTARCKAAFLECVGEVASTKRWGRMRDSQQLRCARELFHKRLREQSGLPANVRRWELNDGDITWALKRSEAWLSGALSEWRAQPTE